MKKRELGLRSNYYTNKEINLVVYFHLIHALKIEYKNNDAMITPTMEFNIPCRLLLIYQTHFLIQGFSVFPSDRNFQQSS